MKSMTISVYIDAPPREVYAFASDPANLPAWVPFFRSVEFIDGQWLAESPEGQITFAFVENNPYGVLDHTVTLPSGENVTNPMRVIPNGNGSELLFTLFQHETISDEAFAADRSAVMHDLEMLRRIMESRPSI